MQDGHVESAEFVAYGKLWRQVSSCLRKGPKRNENLWIFPYQGNSEAFPSLANAVRVSTLTLTHTRSDLCKLY